MKYQQIVFLQGDEAIKPLMIMDKKGTDEAMQYLKQWDYGDGDGEIRTSSAKGTSDYFVEKSDYLMSWNVGLCYIGLERIVV